MQDTLRHSHLPDLNRLSLLAAVILIAYALARLVNLPERTFSIQLPGIFLAPHVDAGTLVSLLVAGLTVFGAQWLLQDHPVKKDGTPLEHWLLPGLTAWVIELPLSQLPLSPLWWLGFALGGALIILVLVAEYIAVDPEDIRQPFASAVLISLSFSLYLVLAASLRYAQTRLIFLLPILGVASFLVSLRSMHLRLHGEWALLQAFLVTLFTVQLAAALHYWPLTPVVFGLVLLGPAYSLTSVLVNLKEGAPTVRAFIEPAVILVFVWLIALWMR